jgi:uncharacterized protein (DUF302 family)
MEYTINKQTGLSFQEAKDKITEELKKEGFGVITEVDLKDKFKEKLNRDFRNYTILGACNPKLAFEAIQQEERIGALLPCNILVQELENGKVEIAAINPLESIGAIGNDNLRPIAETVSQKLKNVIDRIND